jgi:hypothetical protein
MQVSETFHLFVGHLELPHTPRTGLQTPQDSLVLLPLNPFSNPYPNHRLFQFHFFLPPSLHRFLLERHKELGKLEGGWVIPINRFGSQ